jgi:hypothetical protein
MQVSIRKARMSIQYFGVDTSRNETFFCRSCGLWEYGLGNFVFRQVITVVSVLLPPPYFYKWCYDMHTCVLMIIYFHYWDNEFITCFRYSVTLCANSWDWAGLRNPGSLFFHIHLNWKFHVLNVRELQTKGIISCNWEAWLSKIYCSPWRYSNLYAF